MAKFTLRGILSTLCSRFFRKANLDDFFALDHKGAYREAYAVLRHMMDTQPRLSEVGDLYMKCAELELVVNDDTRKARELLDKARGLDCQDMAAYYNMRGFVLWRMGERDKGIQDLERSVALAPTITNLRILGKVLSSDGDERARSVWHRVLKQDPKNCPAHIYLGIQAAKSGNRAHALLMAKRAEKLCPSPCDMVEIGGLYFELEQFQSAIDAYLEADRLGYEPKGSLYAGIASCYFSLGDNSMGRKYAEWAMRFSPKHDYVKEVWQMSEELRDETH